MTDDEINAIYKKVFEMSDVAVRTAPKPPNLVRHFARAILAAAPAAQPEGAMAEVDRLVKLYGMQMIQADRASHPGLQGQIEAEAEETLAAIRDIAAPAAQPKEHRLYRTDTEAADELLQLLFPDLAPDDLRTDGGSVNMPKVRTLLRERLAAAPAATPEDLAEQYIADQISRAPEPLRRLGHYLSRILDEDEFKTAERYVLGAMEAAAPAAQPEGATGVQAHVHEAWWLIEAVAPPRPLYFAGLRRATEAKRPHQAITTEDANKAVRYPTEDAAKLAIAQMIGADTSNHLWPLLVANSAWKVAEHIFDYTPAALPPSGVAMAEVERLLDAYADAYFSHHTEPGATSDTLALAYKERLLAAIRSIAAPAAQPAPAQLDGAAAALLARLREAGNDYTIAWGNGDLYEEAADEIERLQVAALLAMTEPEIDAELCEHGIDPDAAAAMGAKAVKDALAATPEALAEKYIADMVSRAPEPLRELGDYLSRVLDEDEFKTAERYVLGAMKADAGEATTDQCVQLAGALEQLRAIKIAEAVHELRISGKDALMPTAFQAGYCAACEEIIYRLRTEEWANCLPPIDAIHELQGCVRSPFHDDARNTAMTTDDKIAAAPQEPQ